MITWLLNPRVLIALAMVVALGAAYVKGRSDGAAPAKAAHAADKAAWADERTKAAQRYASAMEAEIAAHNRTVTELEAANADAKNLRDQADRSAAAAAGAASAAARSERRLLDAAATNRLATAAALEAAGAVGVCAPATEAIDLRDRLLADYRAEAASLGEFGREVGGAFEQQTIRASQCAASADALRAPP